MFHKIKFVRPLDDYCLTVLFSEGVAKIYDLKPLMKEIPVFTTLKEDEELYRSVYVDVGGYGIVWNDDLDLSCDELWDKGKKVATPFDDLIAFGDATELWGLNESTLRKAIAYGNLIPGIDVCKYGKQWIISRTAMEREYGKPKK